MSLVEEDVLLIVKVGPVAGFDMCVINLHSLKLCTQRKVAMSVTYLDNKMH